MSAAPVRVYYTVRVFSQGNDDVMEEYASARVELRLQPDGASLANPDEVVFPSRAERAWLIGFRCEAPGGVVWECLWDVPWEVPPFYRYAFPAGKLTATFEGSLSYDRGGVSRQIKPSERKSFAGALKRLKAVW